MTRRRGDRPFDLPPSRAEDVLADRDRQREAWKDDPAVEEPPTVPCGGGRRVLPMIEDSEE